jgi:hypothetical protein
MSYRKFKEFMINVNYVYEEDVKVFNWIDENLDEKEGILINAYETYGIIFSADAGGYIEIFTSNPISTPFYEYDRKETHNNYEYYMELKSDLNNCKFRQRLIDSGYPYYYQGSRLFPGSATALIDEEEENLDTLEGFEVIFKDDNSTLFRMIGCE